MTDIQGAVAGLGDAAFSEAALVQHIHPLFSRVLQHAGKEIYLANHSLGRPLDQTSVDVQEAMRFWYERMDAAWDDWLSEREAFRHRVARLIKAARADCIVPKASAGQGLRAVLNCFDERIGVVTTCDEFDSIDTVLKVYAQRGRIDITYVEPDATGSYQVEDILNALDKSTRLLVVSLVLYSTGQLLHGLQTAIANAQARGTLVLVDLYHAAGAMPVDVQELNADFAIGGCYKYLRGGTGAGWLYLHPRHLDGTFQTLDTGWFALAAPLDFERTARPRFSGGGDAFLESTPAILPFYQARAGLEFVLALGVERLRDYSLRQQRYLEELLAEQRVSVIGTPEQRGAFLATPHERSVDLARRLRQQGVIADARERMLRLCPDILNTEQELTEAVARLAQTLRSERGVRERNAG